MAKGMELVRFADGEARTAAKPPSPQDELKHYRNVVESVTQDALNVWAETWGELQDGVHSGAVAEPGAGGGFKPSCGWPEFMEKMWLLRHYLDFIARFCRQ